MKKRVVTLLLAAALVASATAAWGQQKSAPKPAVAKAALPAPTPAAGATVKPHPKEEINADQTYKANCSRCHAAPRKFSNRATATIMRHMRVRANLTEEETRAILRYLTE